jgi:hypothetical protein
MLRIYADKFIFVMNALSSLQKTLDQDPSRDQPRSVRLQPNDELGQMLRHLVEIFSELEMPVSKRDAKALLEMLEHGEERPASDVTTVISTLYSSISCEFEGRLVVAAGPSSANSYDPKEPLFGAKVVQNFGSVTYEIDEAAKCLVLDRSTASAFHSIRCLEAGIRALSRCLGIPDPKQASDRNWGALLKELKSVIDKKWPGSSTRMSGDGEFFDNAYVALAAIQNPWRNATMHLDQKYTPEEARHIFEVVKGFMMKIAVRLDEDGLPLA